MADLSSGNQSTYPAEVDTYATDLIDSTDVARADVPNAIGGAIVAVESELGTNPSGSKATLTAFLQQEHGTDGTHGTIASLTVSDNVTYLGSGWPSMSVYLSADQTVNSGSPDLVEFDTEVFDTAPAYNVTTFLWIPLQAGKYLITGQVRLKVLGAGKKLTIHIYKDGAAAKERTVFNDSAATAHDVDADITALLDLNGTDEEVQIYITHDHGSALDIDSDSKVSFFMGSRVA